MSRTQLKIAIIGAGPAGLTLGLLLHKQNISFTIFELRSQFTDEELSKPAGSLDLHEDTGLAAINGCGLTDEFSALSGDCTEAQRVSDKNGNILYEDDGEGGNRPEISRNKLTKLLLSHVPESSIKWNHKLLSAKRITADGSNHSQIELDFAANGKQTFDLAIGADGAWSRIRAILTDVKPHYQGLQLIQIFIKDITTRHKQLAEYVGTGSFNALANKHGIFVQRSVDDSAVVYIFISSKDEDYAKSCGLSSKKPVQAKDQLLGDDTLFAQWGAKLKELVTAACEDQAADNPQANLEVKPLYSLPIGHVWGHQSGATVIGDAAHLINPGTGEGVNTAMLDALLLSQAIVKAYDIARQDATGTAISNELDPLLKQFELDMAPRAKAMMTDTTGIAEMMFGSDDGATAMADFFKSMGPPPE